MLNEALHSMCSFISLSAEHAKEVEQLHNAAKRLEAERTEALEKVKSSELKANASAESLSRLQQVLEQFQTGELSLFVLLETLFKILRKF